MNTIAGNTTFADQGKDLVNKATKKIQGGLQDAMSLAEEAGNQLSSKAQAVAKQGRDMADAAIEQVRDSAADLSHNLIKYTKKNPGKALLMAAATGALLAAIIVALTPSRD
jgi:ElaB/YqjD/DUF883 family membrane-anchored ribosome-binding protein